jgi:hypothetical protein
VRVLAIHDARGVIERIIALPKDAPRASIVHRAGLFATELDAPGTPLGADSGTSEATLAGLIKGQRVDFKAEAKLVKKRPSGRS